MQPLRTLLLASALVAAACVAPRTSLEPEPSLAGTGGTAPAVTVQAEPAVMPQPRSTPAEAARAPQESAPNRDLHGPENTERYVSMLQSEGRVRELKPELVARKIDERLALADDAVIADLGCGPGVFIEDFAELVPAGFVLAIDVEPRQLDALRERLVTDAIDNVIPVLASYTTPHIPPGLCDAIFVADTYHHFEGRIEYFRDLRRALVPGGHLVILEYKEGDLPIGPPADHKLELAARHAELEQAGYELVESLATHIWHDFEIWRLRRADR